MCLPDDNKDDPKVLLTPVDATIPVGSCKYKRFYLISAGFVLTGILLAVVLVIRNQRSNEDSAKAAVAGVYPTVSPTAVSTGAAIPTSAPLATTRLPTSAPTISVPDYVEQLILSVSTFTGSEFDDPLSHQSLALKWLQTDAAADRAGQLRMSDSRLIQRYALACIYFSTNSISHAYTDLEFGVGRTFPWYNATGWRSQTSECEWYGVTCAPLSSSSKSLYVVGLKLNENRLTGSFPREVTLLTYIRRIDLYDNWLWNKGDKGNAWLGDMVSLEYLYYGSTYFEYDGIPTQISQLVNLSKFLLVTAVAGARSK